MEFITQPLNEKRPPAELVVLPFFGGSRRAEPATDLEWYKTSFNLPGVLEDFRGNEGEQLFIYSSDRKSDKRILLVGLGEREKINTEKLRRNYALVVRACQQKKIEKIDVFLPTHILNEESIILGISEGLLLANYAFDQLKQAKKPQPNLLKTVNLIGVSKQGLSQANRCVTIAKGVYLARDLVNGNADDVTPQYLSKLAQDLAKKLPQTKVTVLDKKKLEKEKMGLILAVNRGSDKDPALIILSYKGNAKSKDHTVLIGKGITYDTGGLNLKPCTSMETMKADMAGGAAVLGTLYAVASLRLKINLTVIVPATENSIDAKSYKPGDVYNSYLGPTIEVNNPDAEGRLVLADAIAYANQKLNPTRIIDIATLTGGIDIALGAEACGLFSNHDVLADSLIRSGSKTYERVWRLPLYEEYRDHLKSDIADMKNSAGRSASSITAAMFLQEFVGSTPWAHLDIASTAYLSEKKRYHPKYATGFGVRLLVDLLSSETEL